MKINSETYYILEHFCLYQVQDRQPLRKAKSIYLEEDNVDTIDRYSLKKPVIFNLFL